MGEVGRLDTLAARVNAEHRVCKTAMNAALEHALVAGDTLLQAKAERPHGTWLAWLKDNFEGAPRTAQAYMSLASRRPEVEAAKAQSSALLSIDGALRALGAPSVPTLPEAQREAIARRDRAERRLYEQAEIAVATGNVEVPPDIKVSIAKWEHLLYVAAQDRRRDVRNIIEDLAGVLYFLVHDHPPEDASEAMRRMPDWERVETVEDLRDGLAWLERVIEEAENAHEREG